MIFRKRFSTHGQTRQFTIEHSAAGWVAREELGDTSTRTSVIHDWSRVETTMALFELKASALRDEGWSEIFSHV
jgi:hypothetical protein